MQIKFRHSRFSDIEYVAENMRDEDAAEVFAASHNTPYDALFLSVKKTPEPLTVVDGNDTPLVIMGVRSKSLVGGVGIPWLLGSNDALKYRREFLKQSPKVLDIWLEQYRMLENYVHVKNYTSVRWLKRLGFIMDDPIEFPNSGEYFMRFHMERQYV